MDKLIITAAICGSRITREMTPYIPITPEEIAQSKRARKIYLGEGFRLVQ